MKSRVLRFLDVAVEYAIYGVIFFIPISIAMIGTFAGLAIVFFLVKKILSPDFTSIKANKMLFLFLFLFFVFMGLSLLNSGPLVGKSLKALFLKWGRFPLLLWAIIDTFQDTKRIGKAVYVIVCSAALVGFTVFTQKFLGFEFLRGRVSWGYSERSIGPFKNPNDLAAYLTSVIPIVLSFGLWKWKKVVVKLSLLLVTAMLIVSVFWTRCRGGWFGLELGIFFIILVISYLRKIKWFGILFFLSLTLFIPGITAIIFFLKQGIDMRRFLLMYGAWDIIKANPFLGKGIGTYMDYSSLYTKNFGAGYVHNCYLQIWAESGIFSLLSFLLCAGYVFYKSVRLSLKIPVSLNSFLLIGLTAGLLGYLVHSFFEVHLYSFQLSFLFWVVLGLTITLSSKLGQGQLEETAHMVKNTDEQFPAYLPLYYRIFCRVRKVRRQTCVRINESNAKRKGPLDVIPDGPFVAFKGGVNANPKDAINKSIYWIEDDLSSSKIRNVADKIKSIKDLLRSKSLRYTSSAGMFIPGTYTQESEKRKLWENSWIAAHSGVRAKDRVLDIGGASTAFVFYLASLGCSVKVIDNDWSCCGMIYNAKYVAKKMNWDIEVFDRDIAKTIPFPDNSFDRVFSICTLEHLSSSIRRTMMQEVARVLKPGGVVGITIDYDPDRKVLIADKGLRFGYRKKLFEEIINPSGLSLYGNDDLVDTGTGEDWFLGAFFLKK